MILSFFKWKQAAFLSAVFMLFSCTAISQQDTRPDLPVPKNIIFFVGDGMGYNHVKAADYFTYGETGRQVYQQDDWTEYALATYSSVMRIREGDTIFSTGYNPRAASNDPDYVRSDATDSGAAGTALSTGKKTYNGSIGIGIYGDTLVHITHAAKAKGKATGIVSSVYFSHATPAAFAAHNEHRSNLEDIARFMLFHTQTDVIMAPGHPEFDNNGQPRNVNARNAGGLEVWEGLKANDGRTEFVTEAGTFRVQDATGDGQPDPWTLIQTREEFRQMANGPQPRRVLGLPQVNSTLNQGRDRVEEHTLPFQTPLNETVPTLDEITSAAINVLSQNENGFFLMVEGGAIDWASHGNDDIRTIEEQVDFNNAIRAAVEWVEKYSSWDETLIIVTSDHECGYLTGPGEPDPIFPFVENKGQGEVPGMAWHAGGHTNMLVPFYAKGPGANLFSIFARENDPVYGPFIQNTDIASMVFMLWGKPEVEVFRLNN